MCCCLIAVRHGGETLEFHPTFTHQQFGKEETILGYSDLKILVNVTADMRHSHVDVSFKEKSGNADDIMSKLKVRVYFLLSISLLCTGPGDFARRYMHEPRLVGM